MYCTIDNLHKRLPKSLIVKLIDDERVHTDSFTLEMTERIDEVVTAADGIIDSYLQGHYAVPLSTVPIIINEIATDIAVYKLYKRRPGTEIPSDIVDDYKAAEKRLEKIQSGKINLGIPEASGGDEETKSKGRDYRVSKKRRYFDRSTLDRIV